jgi:hypothetical protein
MLRIEALRRKDTQPCRGEVLDETQSIPLSLLSFLVDGTITYLASPPTTNPTNIAAADSGK